ncbi:MAG: biotin/lipoyl-binding protein [Planctomycetota bacterium]
MVTGNLDRIATYDLLTEETRRACLALHPDATVSPQRYGNEVYFHIALESQAKYVRVGYREYVFLSLLDGTTNTARALAESSQAMQSDSLDLSTPNPLSEHEANQLIDWLLENSLLHYVSARASSNVQAESPSIAAPTQKRHWFEQLNPFWIKLPLTRLVNDPNRLLDIILPMVRWCFHPTVVLGMLIVILMACVTGVTYSHELIQSTQGLLVYENWIALIATWIILKVIHEFSHAACCRYHGGKVPEAGLVMILFVPMAYVDVTSSWAFRERWKRMAVAAAGMFSELLIASIALFLWFQVDSPVIKHQLINIMVTASVSTILFNANPLMRFDGYFLISDLFKLPNLYTSGNESIQRLTKWVMYGEDSIGTTVESRDRGWTIRAYGLLAAGWKVVICVSLTLTASVMLGGWGILIAVLGVISWIGVPAYQAVKGLIHRMQSHRHQAIRAAMVSTLSMAAIGCAWFWLPNPFPAHLPCVVDYVNSAKVRANTSGFVTTVEVAEGQVVREGDILIRLENRELASRILEAECELELYLVREKIAIDQREVASGQMAVEDQVAAQKKLSELRRQAEQLIVRAPNDGIVIGNLLSEKVGTFVDSGDVLCIVGNDNLKEVVFSIATGDSPDLDRWESIAIPVRIGQSGLKYTTLGRIEPRASDVLPHPAMGVQNGGPLSIRHDQASDEEPRLIKSRFIARVPLNSDLARQMFAGETGIAYLQRPNQTFGTWLWASGQDWLKQQMEMTQLVN